MILAAGVGSRLAPLTDWRPKALVPVGDRPMLARLALQLRAANVDRIVINAHHHASELVAFVRDSKAELGEIGVSEERDLLGTAGGVSHACALLGVGSTLIWNGDIVADLDVAALAHSHDEQPTEATLAVTITEKNAGNVGIDASGNIVRLRKETTAPGEVRGGFFLGVHVIGEALRSACPPVGCLIGDVYLPALRRGARLRAFVFDGEFSDIGSPTSYLDANLAWLGSKKIASWKSDNADVESTIEIRQSIIGEGARLTGAGSLDSCVVWPGTHFDMSRATRRRLANAVVTPFGVVNLSL
ncbi:MAG: sugar phosphate nucleotidyltransferase [Polyangiaceae bacterium]